MMPVKWLKMIRSPALAVLCLGLMTSTSRATLTISLGNASPNDVLNIVEATHTQGTVFHLKDGTSTVMKATTNTTGEVGGGGQAQILPVSTNFMTVTFEADGPNVLGWKAFELNPDFPNTNKLPDDSTFTVTGKDQIGTPYSQTFTISSGQDRFDVLSDSLQYITSVVVTTAPNSYLTGVEQFRIGDVVRSEIAPVPEPATLLGGLLGVGSMGGLAVLKKWRRKTLTA